MVQRVSSRFPPAALVTLSLDSRLEEVRRGAEAVRDVCGRIGIDSDETCRIEIAVVEALNNAVIHAYGNEPGREIGLRIELAGIELVVEVTNSGLPTPQPTGNAAAVDCADWNDLPEQGRGWLIMRAWMDEVSLLRRGGLNVVRLRKRLPLPPSSD